MRRLATLTLGIASSLVPATCAFAAPTLVTSNAGYTGPQLDLSAFANGMYNFTFGPEKVGAFTFTASPGGSGGFPFGGNSGNGSVVGQGSYGLLSNGSFGGSAVYIGVDSGTGFDQLMLNGGPVSQLGFFFNYAPGVGADPTIWALDSMGNPFASFDLATLAPISTPGGFNQFAFRGIVDSSADIYGIRFGGSYMLASGSATGQVVGGIPEPATWAMMLFGLGAAGVALRRCKSFAREQPA